MSPSDSEPDPLAALAEEFADRYRNRERPSLSSGRESGAGCQARSINRPWE